ncbi:MAG: hypothetical protein Q8S13_01015 [Dehalococcoidia bacterium]|nr:hypothetical protein [Dehalococcoidia bacterium]
MTRVALTVDGESVAGDLLSTPDAIGVCEVRVRETTYARHASKLTARDEEARKLLASGDRFVTRDPIEIVEQAAKANTRPPETWTLAHLERMRAYVLALHAEAMRSRRPGRRAQEIQALLGITRGWIKAVRIARNAVEAGLTPEEARDPYALLEHARKCIRRQRTALWRATGEHQDDDAAVQLASAIGDFLTHHGAVTAPVAAALGPKVAK